MLQEGRPYTIISQDSSFALSIVFLNDPFISGLEPDGSNCVRVPSAMTLGSYRFRAAVNPMYGRADNYLRWRLEPDRTSICRHGCYWQDGDCENAGHRLRIGDLRKEFVRLEEPRLQMTIEYGSSTEV